MPYWLSPNGALPNCLEKWIKYKLSQEPIAPPKKNNPPHLGQSLFMKMAPLSTVLSTVLFKDLSQLHWVCEKIVEIQKLFFNLFPLLWQDVTDYWKKITHNSAGLLVSDRIQLKSLSFFFHWIKYFHENPQQNTSL